MPTLLEIHMDIQKQGAPRCPLLTDASPGMLKSILTKTYGPLDDGQRHRSRAPDKANTECPHERFCVPLPTAGVGGTGLLE